ncbi:Predicted exporter of the RND superfamily [hydrothermal vent metagenome]|uniref:Predicted exporter of the RND superfamily n=1 Tax=hydrothermal vent metagenome TaxID=652676 RepID=A0A3B1CNW2_9ZZZZ
MNFGERVIRYRWWIILSTILVVMVAASGARFLGFSTDYRAFFSKGNPQLEAFERIQNTYTKEDNLMIALEPANGKVFSREFLAVVEEVTKAAWQTPFSIRVDSVTNFQYTRAEGDDLIVEDLVEDAFNLSDTDLEKKKQIALNEPLLIHRLINSNADMTAVNLTINLPGKSIMETPEVVAFARTMADDIRKKHPEVNVYLTGIVFMNNAFSEAGQGDMQTLVPIMYLLVVVIMTVVLRSFLATLTTVVVIAFSILTGMGLAGWVGIQLTPVSANAPTIILTLAVADSIHLLVTLFHEMRMGKSKNEAIIETLRVNHQPVFITSLTTAIGFLSLNLGDSPPFWHLGNIVSMGVMAAYVYSVLFLPAVLAVLPLKVKGTSQGRREFFDRFADFVIQHRNRLFWGMLAFIVVLAAQIPRIEIDEKFNEYFDSRYQFRTDNDYVESRLTGFESISYSLNSGESGGISNPEYLEKVEQFADWYRQQPGVIYVNTLTDIMKRLNKNLNFDDPAFYRIPDERNLSAQYLLLYELSLPFGLDLNNQINVDKSSTRFTAVLGSISTRDALDLEDSAQQWLKANGLPSMATHGASPLIMFSHIAERNLKSMMGGTLLALLLISIILMVVLRSLKIGMISIIPNIGPVLMTFGVWGLIYQQIGFAVAVVAPVALGIIVDDTVHFLSKYLRARREQGKSPEDAVRYSFHTVGTALGVTSFILVAGFLVLSYSGFTMNSHLGIMTTIAIVSALLADFLFLPPLLMKLGGEKNEAPGITSSIATETS